MAAVRHTTSAQIARIVRSCLESGHAVEIDGLGAFRPDPEGGFRFEPQVCPKVFLAYVAEDHEEADRLDDAFRSRGFDPWLDRRKLLPGQNWPRAISQAISVSDFFVACFSERSVAKRGMFYSELRHALDCASRLPMEEVYFIPVRLSGLFAVDKHLDLGAQFTFGNLLGKDGGTDSRALAVFVNYRL